MAFRWKLARVGSARYLARSRIRCTRVSARLRTHGTGCGYRELVYMHPSLSLSVSVCLPLSLKAGNAIEVITSLITTLHAIRDRASSCFTTSVIHTGVSAAHSGQCACACTRAHVLADVVRAARRSIGASARALALVRERAVCRRTRDALTDLASAATLCAPCALRVLARPCARVDTRIRGCVLLNATVYCIYEQRNVAGGRTRAHSVYV